METRVMKITWTIAALATSASLVEAQTTPRPPAPAPATAPAPTTRPTPRAPRAVEPWAIEMPSPVWSSAPLALEALTPMPAMAPMELTLPFEFAFEPFEFTHMPDLVMPHVAPVPAMELFTPGVPVMELFTPGVPAMELFTPGVPAMELFTPRAPSIDWIPGQGGVTPRPAPARDRELDADLRRLMSELDRAEAARERATGAQERTAQRAVEQQLAQAARQADMADRQMQRTFEQHLREANAAARADMAHALSFDTRRVTVPPSWAPQDVADSSWRQARELFNRGEWGQAVQAFRAIPTRYPNSAYAPQAAYYQAFALFRIGGTNELREALAALEAARTKYPNAQSKSEAATLATRIRGVLAQRGDAEARAALATMANEQGATCDREEQAVQTEAMNALSRSDAGNVNELITRVLARKDECSIPLRRNALFLVGQRRDAPAVTILAGVARNDPSVDVRAEAIGVLARLPNEESVPVLEELVRDSDERIQRTAIRALVRHPSARASAAVRALVERDDVSERVRSEALSAFNADRATADDITWLRTLYTRFTNPTLKARTLAAIVRVGGPEVDQWLITIARDDAQPSEIRSTAMRRIGQTLPIADLARLYDSATQQRFRNEIISVLGKRKEDAASDKLIDIVKNGTDPSLRRSAISAITNKNDPRATQLLLDIINK